MTVPSYAPSVARSTAAMTVLTGFSRLTGFVRVLVVVAVLGTTYLGNTYQSANTVPNLLFELVAAGALQAVLIPTLVELLDLKRPREAEHVAGSVLGLAIIGLGAVAAAGMLLAPLVMRLLVWGVDDPGLRSDQVWLGTVFLWIFLPQVVFYAWNMVATGVLNAHNRFALPVFAPVVNNVVVIAAYLTFASLRGNKPPRLDLSWPEIAVLAGGTTLGVIAFCAVPVIGARRCGFRLRPRFDHRHPRVRRLARLGAWAALFLAMTQVLLATVLVLGNRIEGGVVAYQAGFTFFLLPHALFALPVLTALFPPLSRQAQAGDWDGFGRSMERGLAVIAYFILPAAAALLAAAPVIARAFVFGEGDPSPVAAAIVGFAPGVAGYGAFLFLSRVCYATDDTRTPALVNVGVAAGGSVLMAVTFALASGEGKVAALAGSYSAAHLAGTVVLYHLIRRRLPLDRKPSLHRLAKVALVGAVLAAATIGALVSILPEEGRMGSVLALAGAGAAGLVVYLGAGQLLGAGGPRTVLRLLDEPVEGVMAGGPVG